MEFKELSNNIWAKYVLFSLERLFKTTPKLTRILTGFITFLVMASGALKQMVSKLHHLIRGSFFKSPSDTLILSLPVTKKKRMKEKWT